MSDALPQPLGTPEEFHEMLVELAMAYAPRRFAICEEFGDRVDGRVFAWGMAFVDRAVVCREDSLLADRFSAAEAAVRLFSRAGRRLRLIWLDRADTPALPVPAS